MHFDVAIIGGGPGGASCGATLRKYDPTLKVAIFEREQFPREHVGESQLPIVCNCLAELGVWDRVEAANFPIKVGATYKWGTTDESWHVNFIPNAALPEEPRPAQFQGVRTRTAFQVDRAIYDKILLDFAAELGCEVEQGTGVSTIQHEGDRVTGLVLKDGRTITADHYVDASGHSGILRRAMGVEVEYPTSLQNVAFWDYWQDAEWAESIGMGGTRAQIMSLGYGWIWFFPIGPTRTSVGLVCPASYYKESGRRPEELYRSAIADEPLIRELMKNAHCEGLFSTTKDWSFISARMTGENWMLVGEAGGFADPILSAGLSLTHSSAREAAFTILEMRRGEDANWLKDQYDGRNRRRVLQHIRFADYWYKCNAHFSELKEFTSQIAKDAGLDLDAESAFQWLGRGGFVDEDMQVGGIGAFSFNGLHQIAQRLSKDAGNLAYAGFNHFELQLEGANRVYMPLYWEGTVKKVPAFERDGKVLPLLGHMGIAHALLQKSPTINRSKDELEDKLRALGVESNDIAKATFLECLEALIRDGWVTCSIDPSQTVWNSVIPESTAFFEDSKRS
jgi:flavin-dependent dehydrogenase